ncbi:molybdopterin molybdotransferase MoeA [Caulobacter segnis]|uniref:molybdopterin molybdotransferase MoeA n=1 Tax=Caulobacter segnis TaxID=88688 RepID=UPI00285C62BF|nr:molybdopterin molybdotransferase MoeA [Caulobacter segnis]MDR6623907.1 molybdopterin molybdotransferase [Caulobacter segnis]
MIPYQEALDRIIDQVRPLGIETIGLADAAGRRLAKPVIAARDAPLVAVSAMDGYALRDGDLKGVSRSLPIIGAAYAGRGLGQSLPDGACARVFTGAPVPDGADRIVLQEEVAVVDGRAQFLEAVGGKRHIRPAGCDFRRGEILVDAGLTLNPQRLTAAAAADLGAVCLWRRPRVAILATGDELAEPGQAGADPNKISESVSFGVAALIAAWGGEVTARRCASDDLATLQALAAQLAQTVDVVVLIGGASVGERDHARSAFVGPDFRLVFAGVAIKPGKPVWSGRAGERWIVGLPGNPTSALVTARLLLVPLIVGLGGGDPTEALVWRDQSLAASLAAPGPRETFVRARLTAAGAEPLEDQDSASQKALAQADLLIRLAGGGASTPIGARVSCLAL